MYEAAQRPSDKPDGIGRERGDDAIQFIPCVGEEQSPEHQSSCGAIEKELIPFDDGAGHGGTDHLLQIGQITGVFVLHMPRFPFSSSRDSEPAGFCDEYRRSEEHTSELQSLMRISYAVSCLKKKKH